MSRTLANVLLDLQTASVESKRLDILCEATPDRAEKERLGDQWAEQDKVIDRLRAEWSELFRDATGVSWAQVEAAIQSAHL